MMGIREGVYVLRCLRLNFSNRKSGKGKSSKMTSVATLIAPEMTMKSGPLKQPPGSASMSQARETGWQTKSWAYISYSVVRFFEILRLTHKEDGETERSHETCSRPDSSRLYDPR
jgi:hypothetical protein